MPHNEGCPFIATRHHTAYLLGILAALILAVLMPATARADAIDGDWCRDGAQRMSIHGETIVTPGGTSLKGQYSRHAFSYVVPQGEPGTGQTVDIILRGEYLAQSRQSSGDAAAADAPVLDWRRCQGGIS